MKKVISLLLVFAMIFAFAACGEKKTNEPETTTEAPLSAVTINVATLKGPSGVAMVKLMEDAETKTAKNDYKFSLLDNPKNAAAGIISGEYDIASVPVNMASVLYNKLDGKVVLLSADTKGVLYLLEQGDTIHSIADLAGKKVYATGKGATPEHIFNYILEKNNLTDKVEVEYLSTHDELMTKAAAGEVAISILPQPKVTVATMKNPKLRVALDLTEEFEKVSDNANLIMGVVVARRDFVEKNPEAVKMFLQEYKASVDYISTNLDETANLCEKFGVIPKAPMAKAAIPKCNIVYMDGKNMMDSVKANLELFFNADPKSIGGKLPGDDLYFSAN